MQKAMVEVIGWRRGGRGELTASALPYQVGITWKTSSQPFPLQFQQGRPITFLQQEICLFCSQQEDFANIISAW